MLNPAEGEIFCVDKPLGWTSFDVVKRVRHVLSRRMGVKKLKVGHAGTLDPLATGVMILATGRCTKRIEELQSHTKEYVATLRLGATTIISAAMFGKRPARGKRLSTRSGGSRFAKSSMTS